jgi:hypothetical protein
VDPSPVPTKNEPLTATSRKPTNACTAAHAARKTSTGATSRPGRGVRLGHNARPRRLPRLGQRLPLGETYAGLMQGCVDNGEAELDNGAVIREIRRRLE